MLNLSTILMTLGHASTSEFAASHFAPCLLPRDELRTKASESRERSHCWHAHVSEHSKLKVAIISRGLILRVWGTWWLKPALDCVNIRVQVALFPLLQIPYDVSFSSPPIFPLFIKESFYHLCCLWPCYRGKFIFGIRVCRSPKRKITAWKTKIR